MKGEPVGPNPGITEYRHSDGFTIHFDPNPKVEQEWYRFMQPGTLTLQEAKAAAAEILRKRFVDATLNLVSPDRQEDPNEIDTIPIQQGNKNGIFRVTAGESTFVFVLSRGTPQLNQETCIDAENLSDLRGRLEEYGLPLFVPQTYVLDNKTAVTGFSSEYLPEHVELGYGPNPYLLTKGVFYPYFIMNDPRPKADDYMHKMEEAMRNINDLKTADPNNEYLVATNRIKIELIARLSVIYRLNHNVPVEFQLNAGDFMVDPGKEDFDPRLVTIRGGWEYREPLEFVKWLQGYSEPFNLEYKGRIFRRFRVPLFGSDLHLINAGLQRSQELAGAAA